jgi:hypothetical protein
VNRARRGALTLVVLGALAAPAALPAVAGAAKTWNDAALWDFADRRQAQLEPRWQPAQSTYLPVGNTDDVRLDANMLSVHAAAAKDGHQGPSRHDDRVVQLADVLTRAPALLMPPTAARSGQGHVPGWSSSTIDPGAQHVAIDPQVALALAAAWEVRDRVGMPQALQDRIVNVVRTVADTGFYRYPAMLLNQFNWQSDMQLAAWRVTGDATYLDDYRRQLVRFVQGTRAPLTAGRTAFLNAGLGLIYSPRTAAAVGPALLSSSEYENLVYSGLRHYDQAVAAGMAPLPPEDEARLKEWGQRVLYGDWTHAGELNWDTSLGTRRWQLSRYWGFALQGAETLATNVRLTGSPDQSAWAAWIAERALETYDVLTARSRTGTLESGMWGIAGRDVSPQADPLFTASRFAAQAARLAQLDFGSRRVVRAPSWFAWDPDAGRLAVSTLRYSTGIVLRHPTDDIGGIEMSRLFAGTGSPVSGTGGSGRSAFGLDVVSGGRKLLDTEPGRRLAIAGTQSIAATVGGQPASRGVLGVPLRVVGRTENGSGSIVVDQRFAEDTIDVQRFVRSKRSGLATARLPAWGSDAVVTIVRDDGTLERLTSKAVPASGARGLLVRGKRGGYRVGLCRLPPAARLRLSTVAPVSTSPATKRVAQVLFPVTGGASRRIDLRLTPTVQAPQVDDFCG